MPRSRADDESEDASGDFLQKPVVGALGAVRDSDGAQRDERIRTWFAAADNLAEKAIAALDTGDDERADRLVQRIIALPLVDESTRSGLMAMHLLLLTEITDPSFDDGDVRGLLDLPSTICRAPSPRCCGSCCDFGRTSARADETSNERTWVRTECRRSVVGFEHDGIHRSWRCPASPTSR